MMIDFCACRVLRFNEFESKILISLVIRRKSETSEPVSIVREGKLIFCSVCCTCDMCEILRNGNQKSASSRLVRSERGNAKHRKTVKTDRETDRQTDREKQQQQQQRRRRKQQTSSARQFSDVCPNTAKLSIRTLSSHLNCFSNTHTFAYFAIGPGLRGCHRLAPHGLRGLGCASGHSSVSCCQHLRKTKRCEHSFREVCVCVDVLSQPRKRSQ